MGRRQPLRHRKASCLQGQAIQRHAYSLVGDRIEIAVIPQRGDACGKPLAQVSVPARLSEVIPIESEVTTITGLRVYPSLWVSTEAGYVIVIRQQTRHKWFSQKKNLLKPISRQSEIFKSISQNSTVHLHKEIFVQSNRVHRTSLYTL